MVMCSPVRISVYLSLHVLWFPDYSIIIVINAYIEQQCLSYSSLFLFQKLLERQAALKQQDFKRPSDMGIWKQLMKTEFMSSEESDVDDDEEVLKVHDLPWRRDIVDTMFSALDIDAANGKTAQSRRQMKRRVVGETSARPQPLNFPCWASTNYRKD